MNNEELVSTLNALIETCDDGELGFRTCSECERNPSRKILFMDRALQCAAAAAELQGLVRGRGGNPTTSGTVKGAMHRRWIDVKAAILGKDDEAVLRECVRGEDAALQNYRNALEKDLPIEIRRVVERQYQGALRNHDMVKHLLDQAGIAS